MTITAKNIREKAQEVTERRKREGAARIEAAKKEPLVDRVLNLCLIEQIDDGNPENNFCEIHPDRVSADSVDSVLDLHPQLEELGFIVEKAKSFCSGKTYLKVMW